MCGIVGVVGNPSAAQVVLQGLARLEYRGYDSAGLATLNQAGALVVRKAAGKLAALNTLVVNEPLGRHHAVALGHTRWATHGAATDTNAHPHVSSLGAGSRGPKVAVVHNGIVENYADLRAELTAAGAVFTTQTDTEVLPNLVAQYLNEGLSLAQAVHRTAARCHGAFAFVALVENQPHTLAATRRGAPLCVGLGNNDGFDAAYVASDPLALAGVCTQFIYLAENDVVVLTPHNGLDGVDITAADGRTVQATPVAVNLDAELTGKGNFKHFMLKEMHEQPLAITKILEAYTDATLHPTLPITAKLPHRSEPPCNVHMVACGTAYLAGCVGKYYFEQLAGYPVNVDVASEFRYRNPVLLPGGVFIAISQSGETADTLAALEYAKAAGQHCIVITNSPNSSMARVADDVIDLLAGREIAVASTKAFTAMVAILALLALHFAHGRTLKCAGVGEYITQLRALPTLLTAALEPDPALESLAHKLAAQGSSSALYLGRGILAPLAYEGALKLKEIAYIHAEGYASGEMKHGPIALVDSSLPVINLAAGDDPVFEKTVSNLQEVLARGGQVVLFTDAPGLEKLALTGGASAPGKRRAGDAGYTVLDVPHAPWLLTPMVFAVALQKLAYHTAVAKGTDVDQPRNLAKSVTVE